MPLLLRPIPEFTQPDFDVVWRERAGDPGNVVGRLYHSAAASTRGERPWWWGLAGEHRPGRQPPHDGITRTRECAMAALRRCWESKTDT